ncbi:MAG: hypothetical protein ACOYMF_05435 [Bacteroidales bacterium]
MDEEKTKELSALEGYIKLQWNYLERIWRDKGIVYLKPSSIPGKFDAVRLFPWQTTPKHFDFNKMPPQFRQMTRRERRSGETHI